MIHVQYTEKKNTKGDNGTMADTNEEHTQIDEDEPQIDEDQVWIELIYFNYFINNYINTFIYLK